jgi:hypothetical protein
MQKIINKVKCDQAQGPASRGLRTWLTGPIIRASAVGLGAGPSRPRSGQIVGPSRAGKRLTPHLPAAVTPPGAPAYSGSVSNARRGGEDPV